MRVERERYRLLSWHGNSSISAPLSFPMLETTIISFPGEKLEASHKLPSTSEDGARMPVNIPTVVSACASQMCFQFASTAKQTTSHVVTHLNASFTCLGPVDLTTNARLLTVNSLNAEEMQWVTCYL